MDIGDWLHHLGLGRYEPLFRDHDIDVEVLPELTDADLEKLGISLGHRRKLLKAIAALREPGPAPPRGAAPEPGPTQLAGRGAERRQLTVLFCDLVGSTELAARLDPEDMSGLIRAYQNAVADEIRRFEGHIAKFMGDGVLAYFGWPQADEHDAERAVRAGLAAVEAVGRLAAPDRAPLAARVGIATGLVVVGDLIGEGAAQEQAVVGDTPNLAARLQALAQAGSVVIGPNTRRLVGGLFELADLGAHDLKGFAQPVRAWRVLGPGRAEGRFEARQQAAGATPLVGREQELALLLGRWRRAGDGEGQVVLLQGEPGIGKSRLVQALRERLGGEPHMALRYQCSPYHTTSPLHPAIEQLERAAGFQRDDPAEAKLDMLEALLGRTGSDLSDAAPLLAALLGIPAGERYPPLCLTPQRQRALTLEVLLGQLVGLAAEPPVLVVLEDAHWIDPTTSELFDLIIERARDLRALVVVTFRPEFQPRWTGHGHVSTLNLSRLSRRQGATMVERVAGGRALPEEVAAQIVAKTDGVPLFVEELTKTVLDSGLLREEGDRYALRRPLPPLAIPSTLHDSLLARLDRLAPVKQVAQIGAAIGRDFSYELLAAVLPMPDDALQDALGRLCQSELIFCQGEPPKATYSFKHALVQDAAYQSLLKSRRQQLHARIAQVLETRFPATAEAEPELLAHHCTQAGLIERAVHYWYNAGRQAIARSATVEALAQLQQALDLLGSLPIGPDRDDRELDLQLALGAALISTKGWAAGEVGTTYARARALCISDAHFPRLLGALSGLLAHHLHRSSKYMALQIATEMLGLAEQRQDRSAQAASHRFLAATLLFSGQLLSAFAHFERFLALYDPADRGIPINLWGPDPRVTGLLFMALILLFQGHPDQALVRSQEALAAAYELGHPYTTCQSQYLVCWLHQVLREGRVVEERSSELMALATEHRLPAWAGDGTVLHGWAVADRGATEAGVAELRRGLAAKEAMGVQQHTPGMLGLLAGLYIKMNQAAEALQVLDEALARTDRLEERWFESDLHRLSGEALLVDSSARCDEAEGRFRRALAVAREQGARWWQLRAATSLARLWRDQGRLAEACDLLAPIYGWFTEGLDTADLKNAKALLDTLRQTSGPGGGCQAGP